MDGALTILVKLQREDLFVLHIQLLPSSRRIHEQYYESVLRVKHWFSVHQCIGAHHLHKTHRVESHQLRNPMVGF